MLTVAGKSIHSPPMDSFPEFMKHTANRIISTSQSTPGVEGYVFDGADGSQVAFWTCHQTTASAAHAHDYEEYMMVVQGCYTLIINGQRIAVRAGEEYFIPRGVCTVVTDAIRTSSSQD